VLLTFPLQLFPSGNFNISFEKHSVVIKVQYFIRNFFIAMDHVFFKSINIAMLLTIALKYEAEIKFQKYIKRANNLDCVSDKNSAHLRIFFFKIRDGDVSFHENNVKD